MKRPFRFLYVPALLLCVLGVPAEPAKAAGSQGIVATVNDFPITAFDIDQRLQLMKILGDPQTGADRRKKALRTMIDEVIKIEEAKKFKVSPKDKEIDAQMDRMAKGLKTDAKGLRAKLEKQGIALGSLKQYVAAQIAFGRILSGRYQVKIKVEPAEVDKKMAEIKQQLDERMNAVLKDPRMKPVEVYTIIEIDLPVEAPDAMLLQARAVEANQYIKNFKGCGSAKEAASGIFNVKIGKKIDAVAAKIPKPLREALEKVGPGNAMGPMRGKNGIQVIGFCDQRIVTPPKPNVELPTRQQVENAVSNQKYAAVEEKYMSQMRKSALVEYKDQTFAQP